MRPRTRIQKQVVAWANTMPPITARAEEWAFSHLFGMTAKYYKKGEIWCLNCGHIEHCGIHSERAYTCPECGARLTLEHWRCGQSVKFKCDESAEFAVLSVAHGWQVVRAFEARRENHRGEPTRRSVRELFQIWLSPEGHEVIASKPYSRSYYYLHWDYNMPFEIKKRPSQYYYEVDLFDLAGVAIYPRHNVSSTHKRNGWKWNLAALKACPAKVMRRLLRESDAEMLAKSGQLAMLEHIVCRGMSNPHRNAIKICNRNHYIIADATTWIDYLGLLKEFGHDLNNAHFVCPSDLGKAHDVMVRRMERLREEREREREEALIGEYEKGYADRYGKYLGIVISDNVIDCHVLQRVAEFAQEGRAMHHCVFVNHYFNKPNSLILSARNKAGERVETVQVDLLTMRVVQSRGLQNKFTEHHQRIVDLVNRNMAAKISVNERKGSLGRV